ncbi:MAG: RNA polymerase sigma factor [Phycisphaerales bacterium]|nr:RNA polymerase sigma factor [Hyphomonadaceae bacterium]
MMKGEGDLEAIYRQHAPAIFRFALGLCRNRAEAEDIVSDTFARVLTRGATINAETTRAYLLTVARNIFIDAKRRSVRHRHALTELEYEQARGGSEATPDSARVAHALQTLGLLPEGERSALLLRVDHGLSYEQIAATLQISIAAAKVRVHRARLRLARAQQEKDQ